MREDVDLIGVARQGEAKRMLKTVTRRSRAVGVVNVVSEFSARGPSKEHGNARRFRIVDHLRKAVEPFCEERIVTVNEHEYVAMSAGSQHQLRVKRPNERLVVIEIGFVAHHEIGAWIARRGSRPFDIAWRMIPWNRHCYRGVA